MRDGMRIDISEVTMKVPYPVFIPLGLPQGLRIEPTKGVVIGGAITRGGERVVIDPLSYALWLTMQLGLSEKQLKERFKTQLGATNFDVSMKTLVDKKLVHRLSIVHRTGVLQDGEGHPKSDGRRAAWTRNTPYATSSSRTSGTRRSS